MDEKIKTIMSAVFNIDAAAYDETDLNPDRIEQWDSLSHLALVTCLEEEFGVEILPDRIPELQSFQAIVKQLQNQGIQ